jgi:acyl-CoA synthetase (AMP-forming)/AMP-acid ligase II
MDPGDANSSWSRMLAAHAGSRPPVEPVDPLAPAAITYTSGTTGFPKGVVHSQHNMVLVGAVALQRNRDRSVTIARSGTALPITILNLMILGPVAAFQAGQAQVLMDRVDSVGLAEWIAAEGVEAFSAVPTMIYDLLTNPDIDPEALSAFKYPGVGGAALPEAFRVLYREKFGRELAGSYGLTEAPTAVTLADPDAKIIPGASGVAAGHVRISIQDSDGRGLPVGESGEICVGPADAGPFQGCYTPMLGYWRRPEATAIALRDGWLHTGDVGRLDDGGNLFVEGRRNDLILRGGANVYPAEIERILQEQKGIAEAAVIGRPDVRLGEKVVAVIQLSPGETGTDDTVERLTDACRSQLARYKVPEEWIFVTSMPRNAMNKVVKARLRAEILGE